MENKNSKDSIFNALSGVNVNGHVAVVPQKDGTELKYLPWAWALSELLKRYPDTAYRVINFDSDGIELPAGQSGLLYQTVWVTRPKPEKLWEAEVNQYREERTEWMRMVAALQKEGTVPSQAVLEATKPTMPSRTERAVIGFYVWTEFTVDGVTKRQWLPIMDAKNHIVRAVPYQTQGKYGTITIQAIDAGLLNKTIMRCFTKNIAMFGLGLYIYGGEDLPDGAQDAEAETPTQPETPATQMSLDDAMHHLIQNPLQQMQAMKGKLMSSLITDAKNKDASLRILKVYANPANKTTDGDAARALLKGLDAGTVHWPESMTAAAPQPSETEAA